jgi:hypothetical protein
VFRFSESAEVVEAVADLGVFSIIIGVNQRGNQSVWLDDPTACEIIRESLTHYLSASPLSLSPGFAHRLHEIAEKITDLGHGVGDSSPVCMK